MCLLSGEASFLYLPYLVITMQPLKHTFIALKWVGLWRPVHWPPSKKTMLYDFYTWLIIFILVTALFAQSIDLLTSVADTDTIVGNIFLLLILIADCGKAVNVLIKRVDIIELSKCLQQDPCRPRTEEEFAIQSKFDRMIRFNTLRYTVVVGFTVLVAVFSSLREDLPRRTLPYMYWAPFDYRESRLGYSVAYCHQIITLVCGATIGIGFDTLVPGLMLQTCAQLNILMHRFEKMPGMLTASDFNSEDHESNSSFMSSNAAEMALLSQRVKHHLEIFKFAKKSNDLFGVVIFLQYAISTSVLCACLLRLSKEKPFSSTFTECFVYLSEMSVQILLYCFYGGEVTIESLKVCDAIYEMDWPALSVSTRRSLLTIMARTLRPIQFTTARIITLNLESFKSLVKLSYSTYNVL